MRGEYGKIVAMDAEAAEVADMEEETQKQRQRTDDRLQAPRLVLCAGVAFLMFAVVLTFKPQRPSSPLRAPTVPHPSTHDAALGLVEEPAQPLSHRPHVSCAFDGINEVATAAHASHASSSKPACWSLQRMVDHATEAGLCFFVVPSPAVHPDDLTTCLTSMHFCTRPLHLTADARHSVYSACPDADPMAVSVDAVTPAALSMGASSNPQIPRPSTPSSSLPSVPTTRTPPATTLPMTLPVQRPEQRPPPPTPLPPPVSPPPIPQPPSAFVRVAHGGKRFVRSGRPYSFLGTTMWYAGHLAMSGEGGDRARLARELDALHQLGVRHVRVLASSEGTSELPYHVVPAMQPTPGEYNRDVLEGLDYLLRELARRDMLAVLILNNGLPWSGGLAQYVAWATHTRSPFSMRQTDWESYYQYVNNFFRLEEAMSMFDNFVRALVGRRNSFTGVAYASDPTIMAWEIAEEPRGGKAMVAEYGHWVRRVAKLLKTLDHNHLVTVGSEGTGGAGPFRLDFDVEEIDYTVAHIWPERFNWYHAGAEPDSPNDITNAITRMESYITAHCQWTESLGKPLVIESFGLSRDLAALDPASPTSSRDKFFKAVLAAVHRHMEGGRGIGGVSFWAWGGDGRAAARTPEAALGWKEGDSFVGDPPSELQGAYSVYSTDTSTCKVIEQFAAKLNLPYAE